MAINPLTPKELSMTASAAIAVIEDLVNDHPDMSDEQGENAEDAILRLQAVADASEQS